MKMIQMKTVAWISIEIDPRIIDWSRVKNVKNGRDGGLLLQYDMRQRMVSMV